MTHLGCFGSSGCRGDGGCLDSLDLCVAHVHDSEPAERPKLSCFPSLTFGASAATWFVSVGADILLYCTSVLVVCRVQAMNDKLASSKCYQEWK